MIFSSWILFAILAAFVSAIMSLATEYFKIQALHLMFWVRAFSFFLLSILPFILPWPTEPLYYVFVVLASVIFAFVDLYIFGLIAKSGAGIVTRLQPLQVVGTFIIWTAITPGLAVSYIESPLRACGIAGALAMGAYFTIRLRHCEISWSSLKIMALPIIMASIAIVFSKTAMGYAGDLHSGVYYYPYV